MTKIRSTFEGLKFNLRDLASATAKDVERLIEAGETEQKNTLFEIKIEIELLQKQIKDLKEVVEGITASQNSGSDMSDINRILEGIYSRRSDSEDNTDKACEQAVCEPGCESPM